MCSVIPIRNWPAWIAKPDLPIHQHVNSFEKRGSERVCTCSMSAVALVTPHVPIGGAPSIFEALHDLANIIRTLLPALEKNGITRPRLASIASLIACAKASLPAAAPSWDARASPLGQGWLN